MNYLQQGDVLLKSYAGKVVGDRLQTDLLHKGQNHHHRLKGGAFGIFEDNGTRYLDVAEATELTHEEHKMIVVPPGAYRMDLVQEYDHWLEESRAVID